MASWSDVRAYVRQHYKVDEFEDGSGFGILFDEGAGRSQFVFVYSIGDEWVNVASPVGKVTEIDANRMMALDAARSAPGGLGIVGDNYNYICSLFTDSIQGPELLTVIETVSTAADTLEKALGLGDKY